MALAVLAIAPSASAAKKDATEITCEGFLALGKSEQPRVAHRLAGYDRERTAEVSGR